MIAASNNSNNKSLRSSNTICVGNIGNSAAANISYDIQQL
jgi:hypothetical protein